MTLYISCHFLLPATFLLRNQLTVLWELPCRFVTAFLLLLLRFSFAFSLWHFNYDVSWCGPFGCLGLCASWTCMSISSAKLRKFSVIILSNRFSISCSLFSFQYPHDAYAGTLEVVPEAPYNILIFLDSSLFAVLTGRFLLPYLPNCWLVPLLHLFCWFPLMYPSFVIVFFISDWFSCMFSILFLFPVSLLNF